MKLDFRHKEAFAWSIQAELYRRHPEIRPHSFWRIPGSGVGGYYSSFSDTIGFRMGFDEGPGGRTHIARLSDAIEPFIEIQDIKKSEYVREVVKKYENLYDLPSPKQTPETTESSIAFRLIAELLAKNTTANDWTTAIPPDFIGYSQHYGAPIDDKLVGVIGPKDLSGSIWEAWSHFKPGFMEGSEDLTYADTIWKVMTLRPLDAVRIQEFFSRDDLPFHDQWRIVSQHRDEEKGKSDKPLFDITGSIWIAPNIGKAYNGSEVISLLQVFNENNRDIQQACFEVFNWNKQ